jgi:uncharacterized protein (DUF2062 family)
VTWLTYGNFITFVFAWAAVWLLGFIIFSIHLGDLEPSDFEVIFFRGSIAFVCTSVFIRRWFDLGEIFIIPALCIFAYTAAATTVRVAGRICCG